MPGIVGFYPFGEGRENWNASRFIYYGLNALQGRGQEATGLAVYNRVKGLLKPVNSGSMVEDFFKEEAESIPEGFIAIGHVSPIKRDVVIHVKEPIQLVLVGDGKTALAEDKASSFKLFAEKLSQKISEKKDPLQAAVELIGEVDGGYSFIALTEREEMICGRDLNGVKPLEIGAIGFDIGIAASESAPLDVMGAEHTGSVDAGEVVVFDPFSIRRRTASKHGKPRYCSFEYVYLGRLDSFLNGIPVVKVRERIGKALAEHGGVDADAVVGVPETAVAFALSYSEASGIPARLGFARTGRHTRSAIRPTQLERLTGVQLKLNPVRQAVEGKDIVLIDDSVVRGNTLRSIVYELKRRGCKRVHVRIGSPALIAPCPFGVEVPPRDELIGGSLSEDEIANVIGADSFMFLSVDDLAEAIGRGRDELCMKCFGVD